MSPGPGDDLDVQLAAGRPGGRLGLWWLAVVGLGVAAVLLAQIAARFPSAVLALHDVTLALSFATRLIGLKGGAVIFDAPPAELSRGRIEALYAS